MGQAYEFDGQLYTSVGAFLSAVAHEYRRGDRDLAISALEDYNFEVSDLGVRPNGI